MFTQHYPDNPAVKHSSLISLVHQRVRNTLVERNIDALLSFHLPNVAYLTGFRGSAGAVFITKTSAHFVTDSRYALQAGKEVRSCEIVVSTDVSLSQTIADHRLAKGCATIGFEETSIDVGHYRNLKSLFAPSQLVPAGDIVPACRSVKNEQELRSLRKAAMLADTVFEEMLPVIQPGISEKDLETELRYRVAKAGSERDAFDPIVVSGTRTAMIHGKAGTRRLRHGDAVLLDFGCVWNGYSSDLTRTVFLGKVSARQKSMYHCVAAALTETIDALQAGMQTRQVDAFARNVIARWGMERHFQHALGHGLGLEVHELPRISARSAETVQAGNVVTIEPGVYIQGVGGVRIEDDIVVHARRIEILNRSTKELLIL